MACSSIAPRIVLVVALAAMAGCAPVVEARPAAPPTPSAQYRSPPGPGPAPLLPNRVTAGLFFDQIEGAEPARTRAVFAPMTGKVPECHPGGGVIRLRLVAARDSSRYAVEPDTTLDGHARRCILETLSTVEIEGISGDASPSARPPGMSALFRIEW
jgi:hypothetical protein